MNNSLKNKNNNLNCKVNTSSGSSSSSTCGRISTKGSGGGQEDDRDINNNNNNSNNKNNNNESPRSAATSLSITPIILNANSPKQLPLKTYFLNKYEQLKKPSSIELNNQNIANTTVLFESSSSKQLKETLSNNSSANSQPQLSLSLLSNSSSFSACSSSNSYNKSSTINKKHISNIDNQLLLPITSSTSLSKNNSFNQSMASAAKRHFSGSNSSLQNSDDDDDFNDNETSTGPSSVFDVNRTREEKRRLSHTAAEQKRRNAIKRGYEDLQSIVPSCEFMDESSSQKVCKATVLKRCYELLQNVVPSCQQTDPIISMRITRATTLEQTIDYIHELEKEKDKHEQDLDSLKKEIMALKIMKSNYEEILQYHRNMPKDNNIEINDEAKFDLFVKFADNLFQSFQSMINTNTFSEMTSSTLNWLEQMCSSNNLKNLVLLSLFQVTQQMLH